jgi:glycerol dehydrogenase
MTRILRAPNKYVQGSGAIHEIGQHAAPLGSRALVTGGKRALAATREAIERSLNEAGVSTLVEGFGGESSQVEITRLMELSTASNVDLIIAAGGGKTIDTGKAVACDLRLPVITIPTTAGSNAACSALSVIYTEDGVFESYKITPNNPNCVLVDTEIIVNAPVDGLVAGMGDSMAAFWEADTCYRSFKPNVLTGGTPPTELAYMLTRLCYDTLLAYGVEAKLAAERKVVTPALEKIVEAIILHSALGFESGGLAGSHSVHNGLTVLPQTHDIYHGEKVAFGILTQMVLEGRPREQVNEILNFCKSVGLPTTLRQLNIVKPTKEEIMKAAEAATAEGETIHATWFPVTAKMVNAAIWAADAIGSQGKS